MLTIEQETMRQEGLYTKVGDDLVGVVLDGVSPRMFINQEVFELGTPCWDVEMVVGRRNQIINFYWCGEVKLSVRCAADNEFFLPLYDYLNRRLETARLA